jgi:hypothetical protein
MLCELLFHHKVSAVARLEHAGNRVLGDLGDLGVKKLVTMPRQDRTREKGALPELSFYPSMAV